MLCIRGHGGLHSNTAKQHNTGGVKTEVTATLERHAQAEGTNKQKRNGCIHSKLGQDLQPDPEHGAEARERQRWERVWPTPEYKA